MRGIPQPGILDFCRTKALPDIFNPSNFEYSAFGCFKANSDKNERRKNKKKDAKQENSIQVGVNEHNPKIVCSKITSHFSSMLVITEIYRFKFVNFLPIFGL